LLISQKSRKLLLVHLDGYWTGQIVVLIHCCAGKDRSGIAVAPFRDASYFQFYALKLI